MEEERTIKPQRSRRVFVWLALLLVVVGAVLFWGRGRTNAPRSATISSPAVKSTTGHEVTVPIEVDTAGQTINAAEVFLKFDPKLVQVTAVDVTGSIFTIQVSGQPKFSNEQGEISFGGGVPNPGFRGRGKIGSVTLTAKNSTQTKLTFDSKTQALLNDGKGTAIPLKLQPIEVDIK